VRFELPTSGAIFALLVPIAYRAVETSEVSRRV